MPTLELPPIVTELVDKILVPNQNLLRAAIVTLNSAVDALTTAVAGKAASSHTHAISSITNLQTQLNQKAPLTRGIPASGALGTAMVKTGTGDFLVGWQAVEVLNIAVSGVYPARPAARLVCWVGPDPGSSANVGDSWRAA